MGFLSDLGNVVNEQFGFGENTRTDFNSIDDNGRVVNYGALGDFATKIDQSAQRSYVEDGFINNIRPRLREAIWQQPDLTVVIKKRMFSSLSENFRLDLAEENEKLFIKASKKLFQNKCQAIATYERLTKIERIAKDTGYINSNLFPQLLSGFSELENIPFLNNILDAKTRSAIEQLRRVFAFSEPTFETTWLKDSDTPFVSEIGEGTGVIELTMVNQINTKISTMFGAGSASFSVEDPYNMMKITNADIDSALADATNFSKNNVFSRFTEIETKRLIDQQKTRLNQLRRERGASNISFFINPQTIISKKVRAVVDAGGLEIKFSFSSGILGIEIPDFELFGLEVSGVKSGTVIDPEDLIPSNRLGTHGLSEKEADLFGEIIKNIFLLIGFEEFTRTKTLELNASTNYVRNKMRLHFVGKNIIQPMDVINVFITSKTQFDSKITQGMEPQSAGKNIGDTLNNLVRNINTAWNNVFGGDGSAEENSSYEEIEKSFVVGPEFPTWLWRLFKNDFMRQGAGTSVFVGLVESAQRSYSDGKHMFTVNCSDNSGYFNKSQINIRPAIDVFNQTLYDPLTPFKISYDAATGQAITDIQLGQYPPLLDENKLLLNSEAIRFKNGPFRGEKATEAAHQARNVELVSGAGFRNVINNPDGFVYRWKEGIQVLTKFEQAIPPTDIISQESTPLMTRSPFAGQDVMNVLSLLITGQPYNYNAFLKAAIANVNGMIRRDNQINEDVARTYIDVLRDDLTKRNLIWGNFVPFKKLVINEEADVFIRSGQDSFISKNDRLNELLNRRARLLDEQRLSITYMAKDAAMYSRDESGQLFPPETNSAVDARSASLEIELAKINTEITKLSREFQDKTNNLLSSKPDGQIKIYGNDISLNASGAIEAETIEQESLAKAEFRRNLNILTQRRLWKVKSNEDFNLFIVDDQYDKSWDIQAYERAIGNQLKLFDSEYTTVDSQIKATALILGLEVFADSQGHVQARPPQYNKVPSSVFYEMFKRKAVDNVQVFPKFLESLFVNQIQGLINRIEIVEDEIRLRATALGIVGDKAISQFLRGSGGGGTEGFVFVSNETTGLIGEKDIRSFVQQASPDLNEEFVNNSLKPFSENLANAAKPNILFDTVARNGALQRIQNQRLLDFARPQVATTKIYEIRQRLERFKGVRAPTERELFSNDRFRQIGRISQLDALNLTNQIAQYVSERQKLLISAVAAVRNIREGVLLNETGEGSSTALFPHLNKNKTIPSILEHMIEDETNHDFGPNSGSRYVIKDAQIINYTVSEVPPPHTLVQVNGLFAEGFVQPPPGLTLTANGGNVVTSAFAVDYDMWRMYGFRAPSSIDAPFFTNPEAQCGPYANYLLNLARKNILQGTITITGNEYYQAGDVVYIESDDMLFYVEDVSHTFNYSGTFQTTLTLKYGHNPGEYIPTMLDIVGKILFNSKNVLNQFRNSRFENGSGDLHVGTLILDNSISLNEAAAQIAIDFLSSPSASDIDPLISGTMGKQNQNVLSNMLLSLSGLLNPLGFRNRRPKLQLRLYFSSLTTGVVDEFLRSSAEAVKQWLHNPQEKSITPGISLLPQEPEQSSFFGIPDNMIDIVEIDFALNTEASPSGAAWNAVRSLLNNKSMPSDIPVGELTKTQDLTLYKHIIDAWIIYEEIDDSIETSQLDPVGQAAQAGLDAINEAKSKLSG